MPDSDSKALPLTARLSLQHYLHSSETMCSAGGSQQSDMAQTYELRCWHAFFPPPFLFQLTWNSRNIKLSIYYYFMIIFWLWCVFVAVCGLFLVAASGGYSSLWCMDFSLWCFLLLQSTGSRHVGFSSCSEWVSSWGLQSLELGLRSCSTWA